MQDLNLPIIKDGEDIYNKKTVSMDDYLKFVEFNLRHVIDIKMFEAQRRMLMVDVPFKI